MKKKIASAVLDNKGRIQRDLLDWFRLNKRDLPWRKDRNPYRVWVSEIMLQQTTVTTVIDYYRRWLAALPTILSLANCPESKVLKLWEGLGYYSRARNLLKAAGQIVSNHGGRFPEPFEDVLALPGIGRYTAGAICSIALGQRVPLVDGNVARVFARWTALEEDIKKPATLKHLWEFAQDILPRANCGDWNEALMELGALVCTPTLPKCGICPVRANCAAFARKLTVTIPLTTKTVLVKREEFAVVIRCGNKVYLEKIDTGTKFKGFWRFPVMDKDQIGPAKQITQIPYTFTKYKINLTFLEPTPPKDETPRQPLPRSNWHLTPTRKLPHLPMPIAHRKFVGLMEKQTETLKR